MKARAGFGRYHGGMHHVTGRPFSFGKQIWLLDTIPGTFHTTFVSRGRRGIQCVRGVG